MLKRIVPFVLLLMLAACGSNAIFSEKFEDLTTLPEILQPDTLVAATDNQSNVLHLIVTEGGISTSGWLYVQLDDTQTDYDVSMRVRVLAGSVRLWARTDGDECGGYALILDPILDNLRLSTVDASCNLQSLDMRSQLAVNNDQWYDMRLVVRGSIISGYIDKVKYFEADTATFPDGIPAIEVVNPQIGVGQVDIDMLTVK